MTSLATEFPRPVAALTFLDWYRDKGEGRAGVAVFHAYARETGWPMAIIKSRIEIEGYTVPQLVRLEQPTLPAPTSIPPKRRIKKEKKLPGPSREETAKQVTAYQPLVRKIAARYKHLLEFDDAVSVGNIGLLEAVRTFDQTSGVRFGTVAYRRIQGRIIDEIRIIYGRRQQRYMKTESIEQMTEPYRDRVIPSVAPAEVEEQDWPNLAPAIAALSCKDRELLILLYVQNETLSNISKQLNIPVYHLVRQKKEILECLKSKLPTDPIRTA